MDHRDHGRAGDIGDHHAFRRTKLHARIILEPQRVLHGRAAGKQRRQIVETGRLARWRRRCQEPHAYAQEKASAKHHPPQGMGSQSTRVSAAVPAPQRTAISNRRSRFLSQLLNLLRHHVGLPVAAGKQLVGFLVVDELLPLGIQRELAAQVVLGIVQVQVGGIVNAASCSRTIRRRPCRRLGPSSRR